MWTNNKKARRDVCLFVCYKGSRIRLDYIRWIQEIANSYNDQKQESKERTDVIAREERSL